MRLAHSGTAAFAVVLLLHATPVRAQARVPAESGQPRSVTFHVLQLNEVKSDVPQERSRREEATRAVAGPRALDDDLAQARVQKEVGRRYRASLNACVDEAHGRRAATAGPVDLELTIVERVVTPRLVRNGTGDDALADCLLRAARAWQLPASSLVTPFSLSLVAVSLPAPPSPAPAPPQLAMRARKSAHASRR